MDPRSRRAHRVIAVRRLRLVPLLLAALFAALLAACGDDSSDTSTAANGTPSTSAVDTPSRVVSLSPSATETLFAIGAGDLVVAVDDQSNYPPEAPKTDLSGYEPNVEAIGKYEPDLVILSGDTGNIVAQLNAIDIDTLVLDAPKTLDEAYAQMEQLGAATGHIADAAALVRDTRGRIEAAAARAPKTGRPLRYYHELDSGLFSVTSKTFIGDVYKLAGLENVADPADTAGGGYPQLSAEYLVDTNPDVVFLADTKCCGENAASFAQRPGFGSLQAVKNGAVVPLDDDIASRWGPRTAELLETIVDAVAKLPAGAKAN
jgi:iron complex transport system substrate-binding protein